RSGKQILNQISAVYTMNGEIGIGNASATSTVQVRYPQAGNVAVAPAADWLSQDIGGNITMDWGDFDRDGFLDLALGAPSGVSVYRNENGQLQPYASDPLLRKALGVRWADVRGDRTLQLIVVGDSVDGTSNTPGLNYIYSPSGGALNQVGQFTSALQLARLAIADFNMDGRLDIVGSVNAINGSNNVACTVNVYANMGGGAFTETNPACVITGQTASALAAGDFNRDGRPDLVMTKFPDRAFVLLNTGAGVVCCDNLIRIANDLDFPPYNFSVGDYDHDGNLDIAMALPLQRQARVYHNKGDNSFDSFTVIRTSVFNTPLAVDWADITGDGNLDLIVADSAPRAYRFTAGAFKLVDAIKLPLNAGQVWSARAARLNLANDLSIGLTNRDRASRTFGSVTPRFPDEMIPIANSLKSGSVAAGDVDGDGNLDLVFGGAGTADSKVAVRYNSAGTFSAGTTINTGAGPHSVSVGDVTGDHKLEIAVGTLSDARLYFNGLSIFNSPTSSKPYHVLALGDGTGDGKLDLLDASKGGKIVLYRNTGTALSATPAWTSTLVTVNPRGIVWLDYDRDYYLDFAVANFDGPTQLYHNQGDGTFALAWESPSYPATSISAADFNGDGYPDLAIGNDGAPSVVFENAQGSFGSSPAWNSPTTRRTTGIAWGDWNNDGYPELALSNMTGTLQVFANVASVPGAPALVWVWSSNEKYAFTGVAWGDFNGDGYLDLAASQLGSDSNGVYFNTTVAAAHLGANFILSQTLPINPAYAYLKRPGATHDAYLFSTSELLAAPGSSNVTVTYKVFDPNNGKNPLARSAMPAPYGRSVVSTVLEYSPDGGANWMRASLTLSSPLPITTTTITGTLGTLIWDAGKDKAVSDNARLRIRIVPESTIGPVDRGASLAISPPFQVRALTCIWPSGPSFTVSPTPTIGLSIPVRFEGFVAAASGNTAFSWDFGDGATAYGQFAYHTFLPDRKYTVRMTVITDPCPVSRPAYASTRVTVGTPPTYTLYLPRIQRDAVAALVRSADPPAASASIRGPAFQVDRLTGKVAEGGTQLSWDAAIAPALLKGYRVYRRAQGSRAPFAILAEVSPQTLQIRDANAACGFEYLVTMLTNSGESPPSRVSFFSPPCESNPALEVKP
ncbi:MAG: FG-GAP-like repeat-containing protein, partial [Thermoflexales bacterium]